MTDTNNRYEAVAVGSSNVANSAITDEVTPKGATDTVYAVISNLRVSQKVIRLLITRSNWWTPDGNPVTVTSNTTVTVKFANGTAEVGDYADADQTITITAGSSSATFTVATNQDVDFDNDTFVASIKSVQDTGQFEAIDISSGVGAQTASITTVQRDDDAAHNQH